MKAVKFWNPQIQWPPKLSDGDKIQSCRLTNTFICLQ